MQGENERQWKESEREHVRHLASTKKFLEVSRNGCSRAKQRQRNVQKSVLKV